MQMKDFEKAHELYADKAQAKDHLDKFKRGHVDRVKVLTKDGRYLDEIHDEDARNVAKYALITHFEKEIERLADELAKLGVVP